MIEVVIDELVVRGLAPGEARVAQAALEARLAELAAGGAPVRARAEASRRLAPVTAPAGAPGALGTAVAGAVWSAVSGGGAR